MSDEGRVYLCSWERTDTGFRVWVRNRPELSAEGETFEDATDELASVITDVTGDGENVHEFVPPPPSESDAEDGVREILADAEFQSWTTIANSEELYPEALCPTCRRVRGQRTDAQAVVGKIDSGLDAIRGCLFRVSIGIPELRLVSEAFLDLLSDEERGRMEWRPVERQGRAKKKFFELIGSRNAVRRAALRPGLAEVDLWRCSTCGWEKEPFYGGPLKAFYYLSQDDLPSPTPSCFVVGRAPEHDLCFTRERWEQLVGRKGTGGIRTFEAYVIDSSRVDPDPPRRALEPKRKPR